MAKASISPLPRLALLAAAGALAAAPGAAQAAGFTVTFPNTVDSGPYLPGTVEAQPGDTVTFAGAFARHPLEWVHEDFTGQEDGTSRTYTFTKPGSYAFFCDVHPDMTGVVHVAGNQLGTPDFTASPAAATVGTKVTFDASAIADPDGTVARVEWDLDGNGSFETGGPSRTASRTYAKAGSYDVGVRYVDDGHETSAVTRHAVVVTAPSTGDPGGGPGSTGGGSTGGGSGAGSGGTTGGGSGSTGPAPVIIGSSAAPKATLRSTRLAVRGRVASLLLRLDRAGSGTATLRRGATVLGRAQAVRVAEGAATIRITLSARAAAKVRRGRPFPATLTLVLRDADGHARTLRQAVTLRR
jgi:plastocyanin